MFWKPGKPAWTTWAFNVETPLNWEKKVSSCDNSRGIKPTATSSKSCSYDFLYPLDTKSKVLLTLLDCRCLGIHANVGNETTDKGDGVHTNDIYINEKRTLMMNNEFENYMKLWGREAT